MENNLLRSLPSVDELMRSEPLENLAERYGRELVVQAARNVVSQAREDIQAAGTEPGDLAELTTIELERLVRPRLQRVLNATGIIVHTNLGRAPLAEEAIERCRRSEAPTRIWNTT